MTQIEILEARIALLIKIGKRHREKVSIAKEVICDMKQCAEINHKLYERNHSELNKANDKVKELEDEIKRVNNLCNIAEMKLEREKETTSRGHQVVRDLSASKDEWESRYWALFDMTRKMLEL